MTRSRLVCALSALGLMVGLVAMAPGAGAAADPQYLPPLSPGCANIAATSANTLVATDITLDETSYSEGEQVRFLASSSTNVRVVVDVRRNGNYWGYWYGTLDEPISFPVLLPGRYTFRLLSDVPGTMVSWRLDCGIPPVGGGRLIPLDGPYTRNQVVTFEGSCRERSYDLASCRVNGVELGECRLDECSVPVDTSTLGDHTVVFRATDTHGLTTTSTRHFLVVKQPQSIDDIQVVASPGANSNYRQLYFVYAKSTSGLPVKVSVDPASADVCTASPQTSDPTWVGGTAPGTCVIRLEQPGDDTFDAAPAQTRTVTLTKDPSAIDADPAGKGLLGLSPTKFAAKLYYPYRMPVPLFGETVVFSVAGKEMCRATVASDGYARCSAAIGLANALSAKSYAASYAGNRYYTASSATGQLKP